MSTNKDVFPNCQVLQHLLAKFGDMFEGWTRSQQRTKGAETGLLLEAWGTRAYKIWIWKNDSQPWTHWATIRIDTGTHQALNHISWGWELLYSCPLRALHPLLRLWIFLLSAWTAFLAPWPMSKLLAFIKLHNSEANEERWKRVIYFYWAWPPLELKIKLVPQVVSINQGLKILLGGINNCCVTVEEGTEKLKIAKRDSSVLTHVLIYLYPGNLVT